MSNRLALAAGKLLIFDDLQKASVYGGLGSRFEAAFEFLQCAKLDALHIGEHEIIGRDVYAIVQDHNGKTLEQGL